MTIKPLTWKLLVDEMTYALWESEQGWTAPLFEIARYDGDRNFYLSKVRTGAPSTPHPTLAAAQAAAQGEWEVFIHGFIQSP